MDKADEAIVYYNPQTVAHKKLPPLPEQDVKNAFGTDRIKVFTNPKALADYLNAKEYANANLLLMSSGTFEGLDLVELGKKFA
jgi:UDP-N-acetylmuramate: L-alanyl-gamma-D-glutamyl-meso-diaminopimelate ligase